MRIELLPAACMLPRLLTDLCCYISSFLSQHELDYCLNLTTF